MTAGVFYSRSAFGVRNQPASPGFGNVFPATGGGNGLAACLESAICQSTI